VDYTFYLGHIIVYFQGSASWKGFWSVNVQPIKLRRHLKKSRDTISYFVKQKYFVFTQPIIEAKIVTVTWPNTSASATCIKLAPDHVFLATPIVYVQDKFALVRECRAVLDSGSQINFITKSVSNLLQLPARNVLFRYLKVLKLNGVHTTILRKFTNSQYLSISLKSILFNIRQKTEMRSFWDASLEVYGACIYIRSSGHDGIWHSLLSSSSQGCNYFSFRTKWGNLLVKLVVEISDAWKINSQEFRLWTDSMVELYWLNSDFSQLKTYIYWIESQKY